jgi:chaperone required for assembly of F1-ATPase
MRDQLEDAHRHRDDGYGRAQHLNKVELPRRFYSDVGVAPVEAGFVVTLDGRQVRTPGKKVPAVVPVASIATAMAQEWSEQVEFIDPAAMPTVRLINSAIESGEPMVPAFRQEIMKFAAGDLLLYRAEHPQELVSQQEVVWDNALVVLARHFEVSFQPTVGILHQEQPKTTLDRLAQSLDGENLFSLTALVSITGLTGSGLLAIGLLHQLFTADQVWTAAHVDEDYQIAQWGEDEEASERRGKRRREFDVAVAVLDALRT